MTTSQGSDGPPAPNRSPAGLSHEWVVYTAGDRITCPGICDRREGDRGDRRSVPRHCVNNFGRVQLGWIAFVRRRAPGEAVPDGACVAMPCPQCRGSVFLMIRPIALPEAA